MRKYFADINKGNQQLALFATSGFTEDHEGISIYKLSKTKGYILVSDQAANKFHVFSREGTRKDPHDHQQLTIIKVKAKQSDGSETTSIPLNSVFRKGLFIAMSNDRTFHLYRWEDITQNKLKSIKK